jgi:twinkle protein
VNAHDLAQAMAQDAPGIASFLLPRGKKASGEWKVGSTNGEEGQSLSVRLTGAKRGLWRDFAADEGGDLLDLWAATRGLSIAEAMIEVKAHLGIRDHMPQRERPTYKRPAKPQCQAPKSKVREWLAGRGLTDATLNDFRIGEQLREDKAIAVFPYLRDGELVNAKYRDVADKRGMRQEKDAEPCLFGWHLIDPRARSIAITEGEIDCMTLHQAGIPALSVNAGAGNHQWIENDWERLERFSEIFICYDDDEAGNKGAAEVIQRLGVERCRLVKFGAKDANQWLQDGAGGEDFHAALKQAKYIDPQELVTIAEFFGQVKAMLYPAASDAPLPRLMVGDRYEDSFEFRTGELSIWTGINGHGKSLMLNQVLIGLMHQGERTCVFSGEMPPPVQGKRLVRQLSGTSRPTPTYIDAMQDWVRDRMWIFNTVGSATIDRLVEVFRYAAKRYGISHFVIDSLMMTDVPEDGPGAFSAQKEAVQKLTNFAKQCRAHVHLVAHPRKARDESAPPGKLDVGGSGKITDAADNVFSVWSARKEDEQENEKADALLELHKQRNGEVQHKKFWLYFNKESQQFCTTSARKPISFVTFEQRQAWEQQV